MELIGIIEIDSFALVILFVIYINLRRRTEAPQLFEQKLFFAILISNVLLLLLDIILWILDGRPGWIVRETNILLTALFCALNPVPCLLWSLYARYQVYRSEAKTRKILLPFLLPAVINLVFAVLSCFEGYIFYFDANNTYHRGSLFAVMAAMCFVYLIHTQIFIITKRKLIEKRYFASIFTFAFPPMLGGIIQSLFYGFPLVWVCMTVSILIVFINIQNHQLYTDYLTGLYNRRQLDRYLQERIRMGPKGTLLAGIMADVDSFKKINDLWGHDIGDQAIVDAGKILKMSLAKSDMVYRYGGDEFVAILEVGTESDLYRAIGRIDANAEKFIRIGPVPYSISFSMGYAIFDFGSQTTAQQFLRQIDRLMYEDKKNKRKPRF